MAIAPLLTDAPIVLLALLAVGALPGAGVRALGIVGGIAVMSFGFWELIAARRRSYAGDAEVPVAGDLWRGMVVNALNPLPWLFWVTAGAPLLVDAWAEAPGGAVAFVVGFYGTLVGGKLVLAAIVASGRKRLSAAWRYR